MLYECHVILRYLAQKHPTADHWYPEDLEARTKIDMYLDWHHSNIRQGCTYWLMKEFWLPKYLGLKYEESEKGYHKFQLK